MGSSGVISGPVWEGGLEVILGQFWVNSEAYLRPILGNLINMSEIAFIWPWVGPSRLNMVKYGSWDGPGRVPV